MIVYYDGRIVAQATPGDGEKIVVGPVDVAMLRTERRQRTAHQMLAHLRSEAHSVYRTPFYPGATFRNREDFTYEENEARIGKAKKKLGYNEG